MEPETPPHPAFQPIPPEPGVRDVAVIIVAAGSGTRTGSTELKQFRWVAGKPMLLHSVQTFMERPDVGSVVCVLPRSHAGDPPPWLFQCDLERLVVTVGGRTRFESVVRGFEELDEDARIVLVHDAARPLVTADVVDRVVATARQGIGAVPALRVVDALKEVDEHGRIVRNVERSRLWRSQTPQGFPRAMIERAYHDAWTSGAEVIDEAEACERLGFPVRVVRGSERLLKVTEAADFARADAMAAVVE